MSRASAALDRLHDQGGRLVLLDGELSIDLPEETAEGPIHADVAPVLARLAPLASDRWERELAGWSDDARTEWAERAAIRELDGGQFRELAERAAFVEVRDARLEPAAPLLEAAAAALGAKLIRVGRSTARADQADEQDAWLPRCEGCGLRGCLGAFCPHCSRPRTARPVVARIADAGPALRRSGGAHVLCCGGCGCKSLSDGGRGPCGRCGWRRGG